MTVFLRATQEPFEGAGVWAITREQADVYKEQASALRQDETIKAEEKDYEALADIHGTFLGRTGPNGKVYHEFTVSGNYLLITFRNGYYPGATWIVARDAPRVLAIEAPGRAGVGEDVTMTVRNKATSEPVANAGIWAITRGQVNTVREQFSASSALHFACPLVLPKQIKTSHNCPFCSFAVKATITCPNIQRDSLLILSDLTVKQQSDGLCKPGSE